MKILFLDQFSDLGGAQKCLLDLMPEILARGWSATAVIPAGTVADQLQSLGLGVRKIPCGPYSNGKKRASDALRFGPDLFRQIRAARGSFDLIYVNGPRLLPAVALASRGRSPVLFHAHHFIAQQQALRLAGWSLRLARANVVACSQFVAGGFSSLPASRVRVITNGTPDSGYRLREFRPGQSWRIGLIGRISPEKGQAEFVAAAAQLAPLFPRLRFSICGAPLFSSGHYFETVRRMARDLPVDFLGWREDVNPILRDLDLLVVPSKLEGMGRVIVEAFSAGVPVVACAVGGIPEVIEDNVTGFLVKEPGAAALACRLREVISGDPDRLRDIAATARARWEERFTVDSYRRNVADLIAALCEKPPRGAPRDR